ncbi:hypothetical protein Tco_1197289 [Tanacetum coccineum]
MEKEIRVSCLEREETRERVDERKEKDIILENEQLAFSKIRKKLTEESAKKEKLEDDAEKEELQVYLNIVPEEESLDVESLATKYPIASCDGELFKCVKDRFQTASPEGYDLLLWGDLKTLIEPNKEDEIWRNQQDRNLINWKLHNFCGFHVLLMYTGLVIHVMVEKKYPLSQDTLSKMLSKRLEVDHQSEMGYELIRVKVGDKVMLEVSSWKDVVHFVKKEMLAPRYKYLADINLHVHLEEIKVDKTLRFVEEPVEIIDREVKSLKRNRIPIVKSIRIRSEVMNDVVTQLKVFDEFPRRRAMFM